MLLTKKQTQIIKNLLALFFFIVLSLIFTFPAVQKIDTHLIGEGGDNLEYYSYFLIIKDNFLNGRIALFLSDYYRYPSGINISFSDARLFTVLGGFFSLFVNSILVYNFLVLIGFITNAYFSFLFYKKITNNLLYGLLGGVLYGFSYWVLINGYGSMNVFLICGFPILGLIFFKIIKKGISSKDFYLLGLGFYLLALCSIVQLMLGLIISIISLVLGLLISPGIFKSIFENIKKNILHFFLATSFFVTLFLLTFYHHIFQLFSNNLVMGDSFFAKIQKSFLIFVSPPLNIYPLWGISWFNELGIKLPETTWWWASSYIGIVSFLLIIFSAIFLRKSKLLLYFLSSTFLYFFAIIATFFYQAIKIPDWPKWLVYPFYYLTCNSHYLIIIFWFFAAGVIILGLKTAKVKSYIILILLVFFIIERLSTDYPVTDVDSFKGISYAEQVKNTPGKAVLDIPIDVSSSYNLLPFEYGKPIVGGFIHWYGDGKKERLILDSPELSRFSCEGEEWRNIRPLKIIPFDQKKTEMFNLQLISLLDSYDIRTIVIHKKWLNKDKCYYVRQQAASLFSDLEEVELGLNEFGELERIKQKNYGQNLYQIKRLYVDKEVIIYKLIR